MHTTLHYKLILNGKKNFHDDIVILLTDQNKAFTQFTLDRNRSNRKLIEEGEKGGRLNEQNKNHDFIDQTL